MFQIFWLFISSKHEIDVIFSGQKHQIRAHLSAALETPILGDHKFSHYGHFAPQRLSKRTLEALEIRQSKARYLGLHLHAHRIQFGGGETTPPPGYFAFIPRENFREARQVIAPIPSFFLTNLRRLGMKVPSVMRWSRFKIF